MNKISIKEVINSGAWYDCAVNGLNFRFKVTSFIKGSILFSTLQLDVVNLCKNPIYVHNIADSISLVDQWEYEFSPHKYDFKGDARLSQYELNPKLKYVGTIWYRLPEEETEYYLSVKGGSIQEV